MSGDVCLTATQIVLHTRSQRSRPAFKMQTPTHQISPPICDAQRNGVPQLTAWPIMYQWSSTQYAPQHSVVTFTYM